MPSFPDTELILTADQRVYHLQLKGEDIADDVILVGDPGRVADVSDHFSQVEFKTAYREFITHTGWFKGKRFTVISTGIGTDNIDIVLNELDAAVNINLEKRELNSTRRVLNIVRLGTCGALQPHIPVNAPIISTYSLGLDGLLHFYQGWQSVNEHTIADAFTKHCAWPASMAMPYCVSASSELLLKFDREMYRGITATAPGFYGPQGRQLRLQPAMPGLNNLLSSFNFNDLCITNFEMETSALYGLGKLLGHRCLTLCVVIANRATKQFTHHLNQSVALFIENALHQLTT